MGADDGVRAIAGSILVRLWREACQLRAASDELAGTAGIPVNGRIRAGSPAGAAGAAAAIRISELQERQRLYKKSWVGRLPPTRFRPAITRVVCSRSTHRRE